MARAHTKGAGKCLLQRRTARCSSIGIGGALRSGRPHDGRAPDYDDWTLNGDLLFWNETLGCALELSSMGIRVDADALARQLSIAGCRGTRGAAVPQNAVDG